MNRYVRRLLLAAVIAVAAASLTSCALTAVVQITAGPGHTCAVTGGTAHCWGANGSGQLGDGTTDQRTTPTPVSGLSGATAITASGMFAGSHTCALLSGGTARCWGANFAGQVGDGTTGQRTTPTPVTGLSGATAITAGITHSCALLGDGTARCWGDNGSGQLGDGTTGQRTTPTPVTGLSGVTAITASAGFTCALVGDGTARCWGANYAGQLGLADTSILQTPHAAPVAGISGATAITVGGGHTCALLQDRTARCWGYNFAGQLGNDTTTDSYVPVQVKSA
jgi:alpha-tubulin suppressor-like RCC1 family protein